MNATVSRALPARGVAARDENYEVSRLAESGEIEAAARAARALLEAGHDDPRLQTYVWVGAFAEEGFATLPAALREAVRWVKEPAFAAGASSRAAERALTWMFRTLATKLAYHRARADATWRRWLATPPGTLDRVLAPLAELRAALEAAATGQACRGVVAGFDRVLREEIAPRLAPVDAVPASDAAARARDQADARREAAAASPDRAREFGDDATDESGMEESERALEAPDELTAFDAPDPLALDAAPRPAQKFGHSPDASPLFCELAHKLEAFAALAAAERFEKAGTLARALAAEIASFEPGRYFPRLFAPYYLALHRHRDELAPYLEPTQTAAEHALEQVCRLDFEAFVADD